MTLIEREHSVAVITFQVSFKRETLFGEFIHIPAELNSKMKIERDAGGSIAGWSLGGGSEDLEHGG